MVKDYENKNLDSIQTIKNNVTRKIRRMNTENENNKIVIKRIAVILKENKQD